MILILRKVKYILGRIGVYFWGFGEKLNYTLREMRTLFAGRRGDQCIIFRDPGSTDGGGGGGLANEENQCLIQYAYFFSVLATPLPANMQKHRTHGKAFIRIPA